jgi:predicted O-methyltransferase YrrM
MIDIYGTHFPMLADAVMTFGGPVLELGAGHYSTPMLHYLCRGRYALVTVDNDNEWLRQFRNYEVDSHHKFELATDWKTWVQTPTATNVVWGVVFIDCKPGEERAALVKHFLDHAQVVIAHDTETDYDVGGNYQYEPVFKQAKYRADFCRYRPYTTLVSNRVNYTVSECDRVWIPCG